MVFVIPNIVVIFVSKYQLAGADDWPAKLAIIEFIDHSSSMLSIVSVFEYQIHLKMTCKQESISPGRFYVPHPSRHPIFVFQESVLPLC